MHARARLPVQGDAEHAHRAAEAILFPPLLPDSMTPSFRLDPCGIWVLAHTGLGWRQAGLHEVRVTLPVWSLPQTPFLERAFWLCLSQARSVSSKLHSARNVLSDCLATSESCIQRTIQSRMCSGSKRGLKRCLSSRDKGLQHLPRSMRADKPSRGCGAPRTKSSAGWIKVTPVRMVQQLVPTGSQTPL